ncbi:hypothetical protein GIY23_04520 [Allosaccharopolyspora coralli]|uniref:DUF2613 family protein n=1 Tax=Allosaccharopolyspora coralli TaxID=2665642 RepID=A0A5Q3Q3I6_9PSEU|nr:hypothetical protein [Allosaccharopolyspora coralli]QGK68903.1 hypothetical protein GIY23_04520 [Allosaccharopolyspora coralli]
MGNVIGAAVALVLGLGLAAGAGQGMIALADPDGSDEVTNAVNSSVNPMSDPDTLYGSR